METLEPDLLRTFLAFAESGSLAKAAEVVGRSPSAVTAQMQRLEAMVGTPLLAPVGRGRALTPAGEELVGHARRILAAHRDAWLGLKGAGTAGRVTLGSTQDFADSALPDLLRLFARSHPRVRLDLRIGRSQELGAAFEQGNLDILLAMRRATYADEMAVLHLPMVWLASSDGLSATEDEVPLALLDPPCGFRDAAIAALDRAKRRYRIAATSASLAGLLTALRGGLAVTPRTRRSMMPGIGLAPAALKLPHLGEAEFALRLASAAPAPARHLAGLLAEGLALENP